MAGISYDRLLEFIFFFLFFKAFLIELKTNPFFKKWNAFIILLGLLQLLINLKLAIMGEIEFEIVYTDLIQCFSFFAFSFLFLLIAKKNIKYINVLIFVHFLICIFAFLQHPLSPIAMQVFEVKKLFYPGVSAMNILDTFAMEETYISGGLGDRFRLAGPFSNTIVFSYFAISSFMLNFYMYIKFRKKYYLFLLIILFLASLLTQTRSLILAEIVLIFGYLFFAPFKKHAFYKLAILTTALITILVVYTSREIVMNSNLRMSKISSDEGTTDNRPLLWATGFYAVLQHPLGITKKEYAEVKRDMFRKYGSRGILILPPHNGFINIGFHYSSLGYILFVFFILFLLRYINLLKPKLIVFFKLTLLSYLIHSSFHNEFVFIADYPFLMIIMLVGIEYNIKEVKPLILDRIKLE